MGDKATIDAENKLIMLTDPPVGGFITIDAAADLYSAAKKDWLDLDVLNKYRFPFIAIGGQDLGSGTNAGAYFFLDNASGWRVKPFEADQILTIVGNLFGNDPNTQVFAPTTGGFNVLINLNTSSLTQQVRVGSGLSTVESLKLSEVHQDMGLLQGVDKVFDQNSDDSVDETAGGIVKEVRRSGSRTTITRQS